VRCKQWPRPDFTIANGSGWLCKCPGDVCTLILVIFCRAVFYRRVFGLIVAELVAPCFVFWPRAGRHIAGIIIILLQAVLIVSGNLSFLNWLTIVPALACFDDGFWSRLLPGIIQTASITQKPAQSPQGPCWLLYSWWLL
jgi:hypothetical protein